MLHYIEQYPPGAGNADDRLIHDLLWGVNPMKYLFYIIDPLYEKKKEKNVVLSVFLASLSLYDVGELGPGTGSSLVQKMACRLFGAKPLPAVILTYH